MAGKCAKFWQRALRRACPLLSQHQLVVSSSPTKRSARTFLRRAFICSLCAAMTLKTLNPSSTGNIVLFEIDYGTTYEVSHYLIFAVLGIAGGLLGGTFCKVNFMWS